MEHPPAGGLERSCAFAQSDWIRHAPAGEREPERIEAFFGGHAYDPHRHDTYAVGYTMAGVQSFRYRGARADSQPGNVIVIHPDELHDGKAGVATGFRYRMAYLAPELIRDALKERARGLPFVSSAVCSDRRLLAALRLLLHDFSIPLEPLACDRAVAAVAEALLTLDRSVTRRRAPAIDAPGIERARQYLDAHFSRVVGSEELEIVAGLDRYTLARQFRSTFGTSPYRYLTMRRLEKARLSIRAGLSLAEAAASAGFADQAHPTRQFRQAFGLTPGRWRSIQSG